MSDREGLLSRLIRHRVDFVVVGGFAVFAHGGALPTHEMGVCCHFSVENLMRLQQAVADLHPVHRMGSGRPPLALTPEKCGDVQDLYLDTDYGPLDCLGRIQGLGTFEEVKHESIEIQLDAGPCRILSVDALIRAEEAMGRPRDRETVLQLHALKEGKTRKKS